MTQLRERTIGTGRPAPDAAVLGGSRATRRDGDAATALRILGALALLVVGAVHLEQYFVFPFVSHHRTLFGFQDYGFRAAIVIALAAEAAAVVLLGRYLALRSRGA